MSWRDAFWIVGIVAGLFTGGALFGFVVMATETNDDINGVNTQLMYGEYDPWGDC